MFGLELSKRDMKGGVGCSGEKYVMNFLHVSARLIVNQFRKEVS